MDSEETSHPAGPRVSASAPKGGTPPTDNLRSRLPDLLIQAGFVFLAVLLALAAEEWRTERNQHELADRALQGILHEIDTNRTQLLKDQTTLQDLEGLKPREANASEGPASTINYQFALVSSAAWEAANMSQAIHSMDLETMTRLAGVYNLQELFESAQADVMKNLTTYSLRRSADPVAADQELRVVLRTTISYRTILLQIYEAIEQQHVE